MLDKSKDSTSRHFRAGHRAGLKALGGAAGTVARPTISSIQKPASSIGLLPAQEFETKIDPNFKILAYKDTQSERVKKNERNSFTD